MTSTIKIEYKAHLAYVSKVQDEEFEVTGDMKSAYEQVKAYVDSTYGIRPPYMMLHNGKNIMEKLKTGQEELKDSDIITLIGIISGG